MFYSETLLSKTGPLARVWLSANVERKLRKPDILQTNIETSVNAILDQGQAPLALRLSGQLLLGVVRIYSRKANFLFDDCNEAILKIRMAFRSANVELPQQAHTANAASLILPDVITELDLLAPLPEEPFLFGDEEEEVRFGPDPTRLSSHQLSNKYDRTRRASTAPSGLLDDLDLDLDLGNAMSDVFSPEVERGRDAAPQRRLSEEMAEPSTLLNDGLELDLDFGESELDRAARPVAAATDAQAEADLDLNADITMGGLEDDMQFPDVTNDLEGAAGGAFAAAEQQRLRQTASPLSSVRSSVERQLDQDFANQTGHGRVSEDEGDATIHHAQRAKRRKVLHADLETQMPNSHLRALQNDRSTILKPTTFLPRDPVLFALMQMQRNGSLVSNILGDGSLRGLAPELRGILSIEVVRKSAALKRKWAAGTLPTPSPEPELEPATSAADEQGTALADVQNPQLTTPVRDDNGRNVVGSALRSIERDDDNDNDDGHQPLALNSDDELQDEHIHQPNDNFDETTLPILHPSESGPISVGTRHAVHLLREHFGPDAASTSTPSKRTQTSVLFQDMLPERRTTRAEATKMFFEVLVLATKDAIKVEQDETLLGGPLRMRGKRGLWGAWAEERTTESTQDVAAPVAVLENAASAVGVAA